MTEIARRYASGIYEVAKNQGSIESTYENLNSFMETYELDKNFKNFMLHPMIEKKDKKEILRKIFSSFDDESFNICDYLIDKNRVLYVKGIVAEYLKLYYEDNNKVNITAVFPEQLTNEQVDRLKEKLESKTGKEVVLTIEIDEALIGGGVIKIGDEVIDGSIKGQLDALKANI